MWRGMRSAGRSAGSDDDEERKRCVAADAARKRSARRYTNRGLELPASLLRRETEEYDRRQARLSGAGSSRTPLPPVKREAEELPPLRAVKREPEAERPRAGVVGPEDYLPPSEADAIEAAILARSAREEEEVAQRRRRDEEINEVLYEQGLARAREFDEKMEAWRREADAQDSMFFDLTSDDDDE